MSIAREQEQSAAQIIRKRRSALIVKSGYVSLLLRVAFIVIIGWVLLTKVFIFTQVRGNEMFPALKDGDLVIGYRLQREYQKNDTVIYQADGEQKAGRLFGRETDVIMLDDSGTLLVNGTAQAGEILYPTYAKEGIAYPYTVPTDSVFILNDYRTEGKDSRDYGAIPRKDVKGKIITIIRRRGL
ncbi:MAG: signal peptidase I [Eubacteriales bacterium]|nr:signal peptidase I [Eubacteriales bacterium]